MQSRTPLPLPPESGGWSAGERQALQRRLLAQLNHHLFREHRLASLRWAVAASVPSWIQAQWGPVPGLLAWFALLVQGASLAMAATYALLEHRSARRAAWPEAETDEAVFHESWTRADEIRSALWYGLGLVSALPALAVALGQEIPSGMLAGLTLAAGALAGLVVVAETKVVRRRWRRDTPADHDLRIQRRYRARVTLFVLGAVVVATLLASVAWTLEAVRRIDMAESERDRWQRPAEVVRALGVGDGGVVADLGAGVGYFALKLSDLVGERGQILAVDVRRLPLLLVRVRSLLRHRHNLTPVRADAADLRLPAGSVDAVLLANTYHELADPQSVLVHGYAALHSGGRLVVLDPSPEDAGEGPLHHHESAAAAQARLRRAGFEIVSREDRFIDRPGPQRWWLVVARKPGPWAVGQPQAH